MGDLRWAGTHSAVSGTARRHGPWTAKVVKSDMITCAPATHTDRREESRARIVELFRTPPLARSPWVNDRKFKDEYKL